MTADITPARGNNHTPCEVPLYDAPKGTPFSEITNCPVLNSKSVKVGNEGSILAHLPAQQGYTDIEGTTVRMVCQLGGQMTEDIVTLIGVKQSSYVVEIAGNEYAIRKSIARFCAYNGE